MHSVCNILANLVGEERATERMDMGENQVCCMFMGFNLQGTQAEFTIKHYFELEGWYTMNAKFVLHQIIELGRTSVVGLKLDFWELL